MSQSIMGLGEMIRLELDDAYNEDPNQDFDALKTSLVSDALEPYSGDIASTIGLSSTDPTNSFSDGGISAAADAMSTMTAYLQAAFDDELNTLQNP